MRISWLGILQSSHWFLPKLLIKHNHQTKSSQGELKARGTYVRGRGEGYNWMNFLVYK